MKQSFLYGLLSVAFICSVMAYITTLNGSSYAQTPEKSVFVIPLWARDSAIEPAYVAQWNNYLKDDDIICVKGKPAIIRLLKEIKKGKKAIIRQSIADIEKDIEFLKTEGIEFDYICYNPEDWPTSHTPEEEKKDVVSAVKKVSAIAKKHGVGLIIVTDTKKTLPKHGAEMAQYADIFAIQFQDYQFLPNNEFRKKVVEAVSIIKRDNPNMPIIAQISTNPPKRGVKSKSKNETPVTVDEMLSKVSAIEDLIDGVAFLLSKEGEGVERFKEFLQRR